MRPAIGLLVAGALCGCRGEVAPGSGFGSSDPSPNAPTTPGSPTTPTDPSTPATPPVRPELPSFEPIPPLVRRLTGEQLGFVVRDVLGVELAPALLAALPEDRPLAGFAHLAEGQTALPDHVLAYAAIARAVAEDPAVDAFLARHAACEGSDDDDCRRAFVQSAGSVLFRGPVPAATVNRVAEVYAEVSAELNNVDAGRRAALEVMLQSPRFLYLIEDEAQGPRAVDAYALAQRLAFALWSSAPDDALLAAAAAGALDTAEGIAAEARRLLQDTDRTERAWRRFVVDWARMASLPDEDGLKADLQSAAIAFWTDHLAGGGDVFDAFSSEVTYLTPALAEARGLASTGDGARPYPAPAGASGLLLQPGVLAGMTNADGGAIVARGLFLQAQLYCGEPPDPPDSLQEAIDEFAAEQPANASYRQIAERRLERTECSACHAQFDPLAYAFEGFDYRGAPRTEDQYGNVLRSDGWIPAVHTEEGVAAPYDGIDGFLALVAESPRVKSCLVERWIELLVGRTLGYDQTRAVAEIAAALEAEAGDYAALVDRVVRHPVFREVGP